MKAGEGWHKGRLGKDSQAEKIMGWVPFPIQCS